MFEFIIIGVILYFVYSAFWSDETKQQATRKKAAQTLKDYAERIDPK